MDTLLLITRATRQGVARVISNGARNFMNVMWAMSVHAYQSMYYVGLTTCLLCIIIPSFVGCCSILILFVVIKTRLLNHLSSNSLLNPYQSSYSKHHFTETTLLSLHDHLSNVIVHQQVSCLCLLDVSAAFDTLDHSILLTRPLLGLVSPPSPSAGFALFFRPAHLLCL